MKLQTNNPPPKSARIHPGPGFRIRLDFPRPQKVFAELFAGLEVADISDHLNRLYAMNTSIRCLSGFGRRLIGPAFTVKVYPGDNLMVHKALDIARPGDVIVIDAGASRMNAILGDMISTKAKHRGIAGFIADGYVRDIEAIQALDFPVYGLGTTPIGPLHRGPGEINFPISCGGIVVNPGDLVIADAGGCVVVPFAYIDEIHRRVMEYEANAEEYRQKVRSGQFSNAWVNDILEAAECAIEG
jgi:RraA family protein